jgi:crotonobetainyl-CoA:carnitine CoA-transferase CaiB-like acyl-CoA transferase
VVTPADEDAVDAWARSGALALTGPPEGPPLGPPAPMVSRLATVAEVLAQRSEALGRRMMVDPLALLTARAAIAGLRRGGRVSCGGASRLLGATDGWVAVTLAREDDLDLVPAWLELDVPPDGDPWATVTAEVAARAADSLVERATLVGLPVAALPARPPAAPRAPDPLTPLPHWAERLGDAAPSPAADELLVVELGSLWAGPLCGSLLAQAGARVVKVESTRRPDGARRGPPAFFDLLNAGKRSVALDLAAPDGRAALGALVGAADVVIEGSRPRAAAALGVDARAMVERGGPRVWVSITGHGRTGPGADRVAFGDDAAVAGGLVVHDEDGPWFCADAVADPATGLVAAAACLDALAWGGRWLLDVAMAGVAAHLAGPTLPVPTGLAASPPVAPAPPGTAPALGEHTAEVLAEVAAR